jgi:hypothetical protein
MKKLAFFILLTLINLRVCKAQDTIFLFNKNYILAKNIDTGKNLMYQRFNDNTDNWYKLWRIDISSIHYHTGVRIIVNTYDQTKQSHHPPDLKAIAFHKTRDSVINSRKVFAITTDIAQYFLSQPNIGVEFKLARPLFIGINGALIIPSPLFGVNPFANGQFTNPGLIYKGYALRLYIKLYMPKKTKQYWCLQGVYKSLSVNNFSEVDYDGDNVLDAYAISEKASTYGVDLFHGNEFFGNENRFILDFFYGIGVHFKNRNYSISNSSFGYLYGGTPGSPSSIDNQPVAYDGNYSTILIIVTPEIGLRIGFNYLKKK